MIAAGSIEFSPLLSSFLFLYVCMVAGGFIYHSINIQITLFREAYTSRTWYHLAPLDI